MNEGIKNFLENFLTNEERKAQLKKRIDVYKEELGTWEAALKEEEGKTPKADDQGDK